MLGALVSLALLPAAALNQAYTGALELGLAALNAGAHRASVTGRISRCPHPEPGRWNCTLRVRPPDCEAVVRVSRRNWRFPVSHYDCPWERPWPTK